jgi:hypothetical protein
MGLLFSINLTTSKSSSVKVPQALIDIWVSLPHRVIIFPLNNPIPHNEGIIIGFPKASQVLSVIIFTCVSSSRTQFMSKSPILASMYSFSLKISGGMIFGGHSRFISFVAIQSLILSGFLPWS